MIILNFLNSCKIKCLMVKDILVIPFFLSSKSVFQEPIWTLDSLMKTVHTRIPFLPPPIPFRSSASKCTLSVTCSKHSGNCLSAASVIQTCYTICDEFSGCICFYVFFFSIFSHFYAPTFISFETFEKK